MIKTKQKTCYQVVRHHKKKKSGSDSVFTFISRLVSNKQQQCRWRTAAGFSSTLNSFSRFRNGDDLSFYAIDSATMELYEAYLRNSGLVRNTTSYYMRNLRNVYNLAVENGLTIDRFPFRHVYTGIDKTIKRALPLDTIRAIKCIDLTLHPSLDFARDVFMFSFYTRGMSYIDMANLRKANLHGRMLVYHRRKTGQQLNIEWNSLMQNIADKYGNAESDYILPIIRCADGTERRQCINRYKQINNGLKRIAEKLNLSVPLTLYVARHSWANIARDKKVPIDVIRDGMGHDSDTTTQIYLMSIDNSEVDKANKLILSGL